MRSNRNIVLMIMVILLPGLCFAQLKTQTGMPDIPTQLRTPQTTGPSGLFGLLGLNPANFQMSHSYTMSYMAFGGQGLTQGLYLNTMSYRFSDPLLLTLQFGIAHQPFGSFNNSRALLNNGFFISGAELMYRPTKNMTLQFLYDANPYNRYYYRNPWWSIMNE